MRTLGIDVGRRRIGLAVSDPSGLLARPLKTLAVRGDDGPDLVVAEVVRLQADDDGLRRVVVGVPRHLDGTPSPETATAMAFVEALRARIALPIDTEDERLSSREAEARLAVTERDWRKRKAQLDAAAAAVILQDYLDRGRA